MRYPLLLRVERVVRFSCSCEGIEYLKTARMSITAAERAVIGYCGPAIHALVILLLALQAGGLKSEPKRLLFVFYIETRASGSAMTRGCAVKPGFSL